MKPSRFCLIFVSN